jgi:hypothetical protein
MLAQLLRVVELRADEQWREVGHARANEAQRVHELEQQQQELARRRTKLTNCQAGIAQARRGVFSPYEARGQRAAEDRLAKAHFEQAGHTAVARDRLQVASTQRLEAEGRWRRLRSRADTLRDLLRRERKGLAVRDELLQDLVQDEDFACRAPQGARA